MVAILLVVIIRAIKSAKLRRLETEQTWEINACILLAGNAYGRSLSDRIITALEQVGFLLQTVVFSFKVLTSAFRSNGIENQCISRKPESTDSFRGLEVDGRNLLK